MLDFCSSISSFSLSNASFSGFFELEFSQVWLLKVKTLWVSGTTIGSIGFIMIISKRANSISMIEHIDNVQGMVNVDGKINSYNAVDGSWCYISENDSHKYGMVWFHVVGTCNDHASWVVTSSWFWTDKNQSLYKDHSYQGKAEAEYPLVLQGYSCKSSPQKWVPPSS